MARQKLGVLVAAFALLLLAAPIPAAAFIRVQGGRFVDEQCRDFTFVGANAWRMLEAAAGTVGGKVNGISPAEWLLQTASQYNITVLRLLATGVTDELPLQTSANVYNEVALKALDQTMVMLVLARFWNGPDNLSVLASFSGTPIEGFFTAPKARDCADDLHSWIAEMAGVLQKDFERNFALPSLDYTEMHMWPVNWKTADDPGFIAKWIDSHQQVSKKLGKPMVFEEFGKNTSDPFNDNAADAGVRKRIFTEVFKGLQDDLDKGGIMRGAAYWMWDPILQSSNSPGYEDFGQDQVPPGSDVFKNIVVPAARGAVKAAGAQVQGCAPGGGAPAPTAVTAASARGRKLRSGQA